MLLLPGNAHCWHCKGEFFNFLLSGASQSQREDGWVLSHLIGSLILKRFMTAFYEYTHVTLKLPSCVMAAIRKNLPEESAIWHISRDIMMLRFNNNNNNKTLWNKCVLNNRNTSKILKQLMIDDTYCINACIDVKLSRMFHTIIAIITWA